MRFLAFYIITETCQGHGTHPHGWKGEIPKGTVVAMTYFDQAIVEFSDGEHEFALDRPCPITPACTCDICDAVVPLKELAVHKATDKNCYVIADMELKD